jgi:hypothetical protein
MAERVKVGVGANANDDGAIVTAARTAREKERRIVEFIWGRRDLTRNRIIVIVAMGTAYANKKEQLSCRRADQTDATWLQYPCRSTILSPTIMELNFNLVRRRERFADFVATGEKIGFHYFRFCFGAHWRLSVPHIPGTDPKFAEAAAREGTMTTKDPEGFLELLLLSFSL